MDRRTLLAGLVATGCAARAGRGRGWEHPDASLRVLTLNLAHGRARALLQTRARRSSWYRHNLDVVADVLRREAPDVVALQEAELGSRWAGGFDHVDHLARACGLDVLATAAFVDDPARARRYGTALLGHGPADAASGHGFVHHGRWPKGYCRAHVAWGPQPITVVSAHLDPTSVAIRRAQIDELVVELGDAPRPLVVLGDLNTDVATGELAPLLGGLGLAPAAWAAASVATFVPMRRRIDWILASAELGFVGYHVLRDDRLSDHRAVLADLRLR